MLPKDPIMLLSVVNSHLRDYHNNLEDFCLTNNYNQSHIEDQLAAVNYFYDASSNQFK